MGELFTALQRGLGSILSFLYDVIPNLGVAIILLTIAINIVLFPLTLKQTRATRAFQKIQPEIRRLQKELKESPQEMQQELMRVQREAGATPGGCLIPLLVQLPIWFALFRVLSGLEGVLPAGSALLEAVREREIPTFLGMEIETRISEAVGQGAVVAIPYLLMLAVMVASQYVQQWHATSGQVNPAQGNPQAQATQTVTRIMPLFIGFISYQFPAGLVIYWTTSNIFRLGQQVLIFRMEGRPQIGATTPLAVKADEESAPTPRPQQGATAKRKRRRRR